MSIFRDFFNVKQKPVFTGSRFGFGAGGGPTGPSFLLWLVVECCDYVAGTMYLLLAHHVFSSSGAFTGGSGGEATGCEWLLIGGGASGGGGGGGGGVVVEQVE